MALVFTTGNWYDTPNFTYNGERLNAIGSKKRFDVMGQTPASNHEKQKHEAGEDSLGDRGILD